MLGRLLAKSWLVIVGNLGPYKPPEASKITTRFVHSNVTMRACSERQNSPQATKVRILRLETNWALNASRFYFCQRVYYFALMTIILQQEINYWILSNYIFVHSVLSSQPRRRLGDCFAIKSSRKCLIFNQLTYTFLTLYLSKFRMLTVITDWVMKRSKPTWLAKIRISGWVQKNCTSKKS